MKGLGGGGGGGSTEVTRRAFTVLVSSGGRRVGLIAAVREALQDLHLDGQVLTVDASPKAAAMHVADEGFIVPPCRSPEFVPTMLDLCRHHEVDLVVPTIDPELPVYAAAVQAFADVGTAVAVSSPDAVAIGQDKALTNAWFRLHDIPTVRQASVEEVLTRPERWPFPLIVKPRSGSAGIGVAVVHDAVDLELRARGGDVVVEEVAPGVEHTVDVFVDHDGKARCAVPRRRLEVRAGEVSKAVTTRCAALEGLARTIGDALPGARGALNVQVFRDEVSGRLAAIEVNARFGGGFPLTWQAGGRYLRWMVEELLDLPSSLAAESWQDGLMMLRYDEAVFVPADASP